MKCFNCDNDADMEVLMMVNGKMKKINICMECYQEQVDQMMEMMSDEDGNIDPEDVQKRMFEFFQNNKDEFEKFIAEAINDENFDMNQLNPENFDITDMDFGNSGFDFSKEGLNNIFSKFGNSETDVFNSGFKFDQEQFNKKPNMDESKVNNTELTKERLKKQREVRMLKKAVNKKKEEINSYLKQEDYLSAAHSRDEMREMNKKIMIIKRLEKEGDV